MQSKTYATNQINTNIDLKQIELQKITCLRRFAS